MAGVTPSGGLLHNVVALLRTLSAAPPNSNRPGGATPAGGQSLVQGDAAVEGFSAPPAAGRIVDQPRLTAVQLEYSPPLGGFDPYARRGTYLDITV